MTTTLANRRYRLGVSLFLGSVRWLSWVLIGALVLTPLFSVVFSDVVEIGLWRIAATVFQWFVASTAGIWIFTNLPTMLARGVTRGELATAYIVFGVLASVGTAALVTAGFAAEHALLAQFAEPLGTWGETLASGARYLLITPIYFFTGAFVGIAAVRFGPNPWFAVVALVAASGHYAGVLALEFRFFDGGGNLIAWAAVALAVIAILVTASVLTLRSVPIRAKGA